MGNFLACSASSSSATPCFDEDDENKNEQEA